MHKDENMYVPTMIFGHLLTSSNYNDEEEKVTGGRNGYGAKLCNIFSTKFTVETAAKEYKRQFKQTWGANMTKASDPKIKDFFGEDFTKITFSPDLSKFKMEKLDDDLVGLLSRRAFDVAASTRGVKVFLNGKRLQVKNFKDYIDLYIKDKEDDMGNALKVAYEVVNDRWEVAVTISDRGFQQVSFVNSIATTKGGRHCDYVTDMIVKQLIEVLKKRNKGGIQIKPFQVKNHMWVFINCLIVNPTFDSQTKENMTLQAKSFGSKCNLTEKFINSVSKSGIVEAVLSWAKFKAQNQLEKTSGKKKSKLKGIPKLEDANEAGTKNAHKCTLILTEGDSAKTLAVSGLGVVGRDHYGVFPLRGKLLNVREATHKQILENAEINNLIKIIGLQYKKKYLSDDELKTLRYGKVMIMTDQDQDGSHIKGLIINFIHHNWPDLLRLNFLEEFITPIVKVFRKNDELAFYSLPEFEEWKSATPDNAKWTVKYYKGLGTSTSKEAKEYFQNMARHRIRFTYLGQQDDNNIIMAFSKKCVDQRKEWLLSYMRDSKQRKEIGLPEKYLYTKNTKFVSFSDFVNLELVLFSNGDNIRSIPSLVDGFKPGQRKVMFTCMKRNDKREVKVAQLAGSVAEHSAYHHGEQSLCMTIVNLAQNYIGSNNINLLEPRGQFGTRLCGGKDSASPRYIFTKMSPLTRLIFHPNDDAILNPEYDDNQRIEPTWYIPIIPMILVNGADGIGTGWMTKIPNYNPRELVDNIRRMLDGKEPQPIIPWYKNFKGTIENGGPHRYVISGEVAIISDDKIEITELPIGTWTQAYKENVLELMLHGSEKVKAVISDYKEYNTDTTVKFVITMLPGQLANMEREGLHASFKLQTMITTTSMCAFDSLGCLRKFEDVSEIIQEYYELRLRMYAKRKDYLEGSLEAEATKLTNQARFIVEKCSGEIRVENKQRKVMVEELIQRGYPADPIKEWKRKVALEDEEPEVDEETEETGDTKKKIKKENDSESQFKSLTDVKKYDYLLGMSMWMLTKERKEELLKQRDNKMEELRILRGKTPSDLWREDLDVFMDKLDEVEEKERQDEAGISKKLPKELKTGGPGRKKVRLEETMPSPHAIRVAPTINDDLKKKINTAVKAKENKEKKAAIKRERDSDLTDEKDEFDLMIQDNKKTLKDKLGSTPEKIIKKSRAKKEGVKKGDGMKQTKLNFDDAGKGKGKGRKKKDLDIEENEDSEENFDFVKPSESRTTTRVARAASKKINYSFDSDEKSSDSEGELFDNSFVKPEKEDQKEKITISDSDEDIPIPKQEQSSDDLFDSLIGKKSDTSTENNFAELNRDKSPSPSPIIQKSKLAEKRKREKYVISDSDSDNSDSDYDFKSAKTKISKTTATSAAAKKSSRPRKPKKVSSDDDYSFSD